MFKLIAKFGVFSATCLTTWMVMSNFDVRTSAAGRPVPAQKQAVPDDFVGVRWQEDVFRPAKSAKSVKSTKPMPLNRIGGTAGYELRSHKFDIANGFAMVSASVAMAETRSGVSYVWRLRVTDADGKPIAGRVYDRQVFDMAGAKTRSAAFQDTIEVPEGARRIDVSLFAVPPGRDLSFLDDAELARSATLVRAVKLLK